MFYILGFFILDLLACNKDPNAIETDDLYKVIPRTEIPADLALVSWQYSSFSEQGIYKDCGNHLTNF